MTDTNKDKNVQEELANLSFKEKILAELAAATQERQRKREEWQQQSLTPNQNSVDDSRSLDEAFSNQESREISENPEIAGSEIVESITEIKAIAQEVNDSQSNEEQSESISPNHFESSAEPDYSNLVEGMLQKAREFEVSAPEEVVEEAQTSAVMSDIQESRDDSLEETKELFDIKELDSKILPTNEHEESYRDSEDDTEEVGVKDMSRESRRKTNRLAAKISTFFVSLLVFIILVGGFFTYRYVTSAIGPLDSKATDYIQVEIPSGSGNKLIGNILEKNGVIKDSRVFNFYTKFKNYSNFQSGYYNFQKSMSLDDIAKYLQKGGTAEPQMPVLGKIVVPEGYTLKQISEAVTLNANTENAQDKTPYTTEEFMATVQDDAFIAEMVKKYPKLLGSLPEAFAVKYRLEGYLFPATYDYYEGTTIKDIVDQMLAAMDTNLAPYYATIETNGMTVNQILTMASLVEKEGATDDDREMIASVFYNRWNIGQPLQSNIAILYAMDKLGEKTTLAEDAAIDTSINSPYNIYLNTGLMPGPVDSPGLSAIVATISPANTKYYYFVADVTTGAVYFAESYEEHSANVEKYVNSKLNN